jgi:hypothetical protein
MLKKALIGVMVAGAATLTVAVPANAAEVVWGLTQEVEPGGTVHAETPAASGGCNPSSPVTSKGFAAPLEWTEGGNFGKHRGQTTAIETPGKYTATFTCSDGRKGTETFTILGTPPPSSTAKPPATRSSTPKPTKSVKPQVAVKPAGAPQTGDGSPS